MAGARMSFLARGHVPERDALIGCRRRQRPAVGGKADAAYLLVVSGEATRHLERGNIPQADGPIPAGRGESLAVRSEAHGQNVPLVPAQHALLLARAVPEPDGSIL